MHSSAPTKADRSFVAEAMARFAPAGEQKQSCGRWQPQSCHWANVKAHRGGLEAGTRWFSRVGSRIAAARLRRIVATVDIIGDDA